MSYKQNAASNREALFGNSGKPSEQQKLKKATLTSATPSASTSSNPKTSMGYEYRSKEKKTTVKPGLVGEEKALKLK